MVTALMLFIFHLKKKTIKHFVNKEISHLLHISASTTIFQPLGWTSLSFPHISTFRKEYSNKTTKTNSQFYPRPDFLHRTSWR